MENPPLPPIRRRFQQRPQQRHPNSTSSAYIIVLGPPNSGKSTTINCLFNHREITPISQVEGTHSIDEFSSNFRSQRNLKVVDTPGLGCPVNNVWDTKVLATLKKYMDTDSELRRCIPNIVLIVGRFDDETLTDPDGQFVKSLMSINLLNSRLFDKSSCNVIILLTHFMTGNPAYKSNPQFRQDEVMDLIKNYTQFPQMPYIIFGENNVKQRVKAWVMPQMQHPEYGGGCYNLVGGNNGNNIDSEYIYPSNLIDLIIKISGGSTKGALGPEYFRHVFQHRESVFLWRSCVLPLVSSDSKRFRKTYYAIKESYKQLDNQDKKQGQDLCQI